MEEEEIQPPGKIRRFFREVIRVLHVTKKPSREEFKSIAKVTGIGTAIIGAIGFIIFLIKQILFPPLT